MLFRSNGYVKLFLKDGEIDFVASPNLTDTPYVNEEIFGTIVRVETSAEIVAKKLYHRGNRLLARDMFDFALVAEKEPKELLQASKFLVRYAEEIRRVLAGDLTNLRLQFEQIDTLSYNPTFDHIKEVLLRQLEVSLEFVEGNSNRLKP